MSGSLDSAFDGTRTERKPGKATLHGQVGDGDGRLTRQDRLRRRHPAAAEHGVGMSPVFGHGRLRLYLLKLLDESPRHGYDVIRELEDRFMGLYSPSAGTVYPRLARLEAEGLVTHEVAEGRKVYRITDAGRQELGERQGDLDDLEQEIAGSVRDLATEIRSEVRGSVRDLQAELKAAAKDVRRENRAQAREERSATRSGRDPLRAEVDAAIEWFRSELRGVAARQPATAEDVAELRDLLQRTGRGPPPRRRPAPTRRVDRRRPVVTASVSRRPRAASAPRCSSSQPARRRRTGRASGPRRHSIVARR